MGQELKKWGSYSSTGGDFPSGIAHRPAWKQPKDGCHQELLMYCNEKVASHMTGLTSYSGAYLRHISSRVSCVLLTDEVVTVTIINLSYKRSWNSSRLTGGK
jgi:hypothetical protein